MGWWSLLVLVVLSAIAATTALLSQQLTLSRAANAVPNEGFYWSVAQYQIAHHRLKQELRAIATSESRTFCNNWAVALKSKPAIPRSLKGRAPRSP